MANKNGETAVFTSVAATALATVQGGIQNLRDEHDRLIQSREQILTSMNEQVEALRQAAEAEIATVDAQIVQVEEGLAQVGVVTGTRRGRPRLSEGRSSGNRRKGRTVASGGRGSNEQNLPTVLSAMLTAEGPMRVQEIIDKVRKAPYNYDSKSENFGSIVQQAFTNYTADFKRDGSLVVDREGSPVSRNKQTALFVRLSRGVYDVVRSGDTLERIEKRAAKFARENQNGDSNEAKAA